MAATPRAARASSFPTRHPRRAGRTSTASTSRRVWRAPASRSTSRTLRATSTSTPRSPTSSSPRAAASCCSSTTRAQPRPSPRRPRPRASRSSPTTARSRVPTTTCRSTTSRSARSRVRRSLDGLKAAGKDPATAVVVYMGGDPTDGNAAMFHDGAVERHGGCGHQAGRRAAGSLGQATSPQTNFEQALTSLGGTGRRRLGRERHQRRGRHHGPQDNNLNGVPVSGQDANVAGLQNILLGWQTATVYKPVKVEADAAVDVGDRAAEGRDADGRPEAGRRHAVHPGHAGARRTRRGQRRRRRRRRRATPTSARRTSWQRARSTASVAP